MEQHPPRLMDKVRETLRLKHYSSRTEETYVHWILRFIRYHKLHHARELGHIAGALWKAPARGLVSGMITMALHGVAAATYFQGRDCGGGEWA